MRSIQGTIGIIHNRANNLIFSEEDYNCLHRVMSNLSEREFTAVLLRFWCSSDIESIALVLDMTWDEADTLLEDSLKKLKRECLEQPTFNRNNSVRIIRTGNGGTIEHPNS